MSISNRKDLAGKKVRAPYRAPALTLVLHHSETQTKGGTGFDGDPGGPGMNRS